ncbi:phosphoenolpyruvate carboxylase [Palaeococcus ferrophilus]|uniref:phosphoenolpyruvate carboxylase n=1 Tax=Palaeococcus ferrophilus TaxID=83868 RepID=UPI00064EE205|nr:phosphoenolpyruvate carboxylase [Palaeococcus ferrophilus]
MIPRTMSTQHPDNVFVPFFARSALLEGEDEVTEAFYAFSVLGIEEQMWDFEGKEVDSFVVKKLLESHPEFFTSQRLGEDFRLTPRVPNPGIERSEAKFLMETLQGIPRSADYARIFYGESSPPIFEVILPMTTAPEEIERVYELYRKFVAGLQYRRVFDVKINEWIGDFEPREIGVIPLFETKEAILNSASILEEYIQGKPFEEQRVFLARSDPAMNYGLISAVVYDKYALYRLAELEEEMSVGIYPIIGVGSAPFRGHLTPENVDAVLREYPSAQTFTLQSSFKYDNSPKDVIKAVERINESRRENAEPVEEDKLRVLEKYEEEYRRQVKLLAPHIRRVARMIPPRRKRKLHIGLFGYTREVDGVALPRAIKFTAALYSIGIPPEVLGLGVLSERELEELGETYRGLYDDIEFALRFFNPEIAQRLGLDGLVKLYNEWKVEGVAEYIEGTKKVWKGFEGPVLELAAMRGFLG